MRSAKKLMITAMALAGILPNSLAAENLLKNPGFEEIATDNVPVGWQREYNPLLSVPLQILDRENGNGKTVCLLTEEWNFLRPQFLTQTLSLPAGSKALKLSVECKGQGMINLVFRFLKDGKPLAVEKVDLGTGEHELPKENRNEQSLAQVYERREAAVAVPDGANGVMIKIGNTCGALDTLNTWGKLFIDNASLEAMPEPCPATVPRLLSEKLENIPGKDVAASAKILTEPVSYNRESLIDKDVKTAPEAQGGQLSRLFNASFLFPAEIPFAKAAVYISASTQALDIRGDADGDGVYELLLGSADSLTGKGWLTLELNPTPVKAVRIQPRQGTSYGFQHSYPCFSEVSLFTDAKSASKAGPPAGIARPAAIPKDLHFASLRQEAVTVPPVKERNFQRMIFADIWMWGVYPKKTGNSVPDFTKNEAFRHTAEICKRAGVDSICIDLTNSSCENLMPWPSKVCNGTDVNLLQPLIEALHKEGFKVYAHLIHNITPFETVKWHYPEEETSRYPYMKQYPSLLFGDYWKKNWLAIEEELMACGLDGVGISSDEQYYRGHFMETFPKDEPARALYLKRFGHELPQHEEDTLAFRQWIQMRHEALADIFGYWTGELKKKYPKIWTYSMLMAWTDENSNITGSTMPLDLLGARSGISALGSDYMDQYGMAGAAAANGWRKATMANDGNLCGGIQTDIQHIGRTLNLWMYGGNSSTYWRFNWLDELGSMSAITRAYRLSDDLEALGAFDAKPPKSIALLSSRASCDWQQINAWWGKHDEQNWDRAVEGQRGWFADRAVFYALQKNGYAFQWKFLERPEQLADLDSYKVLLIPFAYSVSDAAAARIKAAADKGATVLLFDKRQGETDEWGELRQQAILKELVDSGKAVLVGGDILANGATSTFNVEVCKTIDKALGTEAPFKAYLNGANIDATMLEKSPEEKFIFLVNWEKSSKPVGISLALPAGNYELRARDDSTWYRVRLDGKEALTAEDMKGFRLIVNGETPLVLHVKKTK